MEKQLQKIIQKALNNGFDGKKFVESLKITQGIKADLTNNEFARLFYPLFLFSHDFAKSVFGDKPICTICGSSTFLARKTFNGEELEYSPHCKNCGVEMLDKIEFGVNDGTTYPAYLWHLQQAVVSNNVISYYSEHL